jgi:sugar phosphate isomerase/epimerase
MTKFAVQTIHLPGSDVAEQFANAARYGYDAVEVAVGPDFDILARFKDVEAASKQAGIPVCALCTHPIHDPLHPDPAEQKKRFAVLGDLLGAAEALGANGVVSVPVRPPVTFDDVPWGERWPRLRDKLVDALAQWTTSLPAGSAALLLEPLNRYETYFLNRVGQAAEIAEAVKHPRVKVLADLFHMNIEETGLGDPIRAAGSLVGHVHIADNNRLQPGLGFMDFRPAFSALRAIGYEGFVSIECWSPDGPKIAGAADEALPAAARFMRAQFAHA